MDAGDETMRKETATTDGPGRGATKVRPLRLGGFNDSPEHLAAITRVQDWTRERFTLPEEAPVLVSQLACGIPGCPPLETVVAFWTETGDRHHFKIFKAVVEVVLDDIPPAWLKDSLFAFEGSGFECC